jgi:hypothetical protein
MVVVYRFPMLSGVNPVAGPAPKGSPVSGKLYRTVNVWACAETACNMHRSAATNAERNAGDIFPENIEVILRNAVDSTERS